MRKNSLDQPIYPDPHRNLIEFILGRDGFAEVIK